jgi:hypothetical protein
MCIRSPLHSLPIKRLVTCLLLPFAIGNFACNSTVAATLQVSNCDDAGSGSLRDALANAHSGDNIDLSSLTCSTISLKTGELNVAVDDLTLNGPGAQALKIAGGLTVPAHRYAVVHHTGHGVLHIEGLAITDNFATYGYRNKFASRCIESTGTVDLVSSTITQCNGGGVFAQGFSARDSTIDHSYQALYTSGGNVSIVNSTISDNVSYVHCVGLRIGKPNAAPSATVLISNSTISGNESDTEYESEVNSAGCIYQPVTISNTTVAFNTGHPGTTIRAGLLIATTQARIESSIFANNTSLDLAIASGAHVSGHNNLIMNAPGGVPADTINADPKLLPLASNGGRTQTHALATDSPAIDAGNNLAGLASDQRGTPFVRIAGAGPDIGAFELQPVTTPSVSIGPGFTGSWFDPAQSGHGLMLEVLPDHRMLAMWFAFNPEGTQQSWFGGVGTYSGATATITDVALPTGGRWIPNFDPNAIVRNPWGTLTITFTDCAHGRVDFNSVRGYGRGSMNLLRLTQPAGLACP